jgi:hypothetical protein
VGYDARGFVLQSGIAILLLTLSRFLSAELNMNYVYRDPVWHYSWAPGALNVIVILAVIILVAYWPTHLLLRRLFPSTISVSFSHPSFSKPAKTEQIR